MEFTRQTQIFDPSKQSSKIIVIGAGSTGSFITLTLAKLGFNDIKVLDFDKVEAHNIPNQFYRMSDMGKDKVTALQEMVLDFTGTEIDVENVKVDKDYEFDLDLNTILVFCVDNMEARKLIYEKVKDFPIKIVDTRMGGAGFQIYSINLESEEEKKAYEKRLDMKTKDTGCGAKATIYTVLSIASETSNIIKMIDKNEAYPPILKREMTGYAFIGGLE